MCWIKIQFIVGGTRITENIQTSCLQPFCCIIVPQSILLTREYVIICDLSKAFWENKQIINFISSISYTVKIQFNPVK